MWHAHVHHDFVKRIGDGTLPIEKFKAYLVQDYLFLVQFARAKALSAYKTNLIEDVAAVFIILLPPCFLFYCDLPDFISGRRRNPPHPTRNVSPSRLLRQIRTLEERS